MSKKHSTDKINCIDAKKKMRGAAYCGNASCPFCLYVADFVSVNKYVE